MLAVAVCQVVLALNCRMVLLSASREGARRGAETNDSGEAGSAALKAASALPGDKPRVSVSFPEGRSSGSPVRVELAYRMPLMMPGLSRIIPAVELKCGTSMALEKSR